MHISKQEEYDNSEMATAGTGARASSTSYRVQDLAMLTSCCQVHCQGQPTLQHHGRQLLGCSRRPHPQRLRLQSLELRVLPSPHLQSHLQELALRWLMRSVVAKASQVKLVAPWACGVWNRINGGHSASHVTRHRVRRWNVPSLQYP